MIDVLLFDSGVGGLSVSADIRLRMPQLSLGYVCDNAALPYGTKADDWLIERITTVCISACERARPRALVVACNTASTLALGALRQRLSIPVIGTVPAIKPAAALSRHGVIGVLATSATVHRPYLDRLIEEFAADCRVVRVAADALVAEAERLLKESMASEEIDELMLRRALAPLWTVQGLDVVVLGCTHFPLLRPHLEKLAPPGIHWIDSGLAIARRLESVLAECEAPRAGQLDAPPRDEPVFASWATAASASGLASALAGFGYPPPTALKIESPSLAGLAGFG